MNGLSDLLAAGAAGNAGEILKLRKMYNDYVLQGGTMPFEEFAKRYSTNPNPYKNRNQQS